MPYTTWMYTWLHYKDTKYIVEWLVWLRINFLDLEPKWPDTDASNIISKTQIALSSSHNVL